MICAQTQHASCVAYGNAGVLIIGKSGAGKSSLAMSLIGMDALLIADDQVSITNDNGVLIARSPPAIHGMIEARGVGLLSARTQEAALMTTVVDLDKFEPDRLPPLRKITILGVEVDVIFGKDNPNLAVSINHLMKNSRLK